MYIPSVFEKGSAIRQLPSDVCGYLKKDFKAERRDLLLRVNTRLRGKLLKFGDYVVEAAQSRAAESGFLKKQIASLDFTKNLVKNCFIKCAVAVVENTEAEDPSEIPAELVLKIVGIMQRHREAIENEGNFAPVVEEFLKLSGERPEELLPVPEYFQESLYNQLKEEWLPPVFKKFYNDFKLWIPEKRGEAPASQAAGNLGRTAANFVPYYLEESSKSIAENIADNIPLFRRDAPVIAKNLARIGTDERAAPAWKGVAAYVDGVAQKLFFGVAKKLKEVDREGLVKGIIGALDLLHSGADLDKDSLYRSLAEDFLIASGIISKSDEVPDDFPVPAAFRNAAWKKVKETLLPQALEQGLQKLLSREVRLQILDAAIDGMQKKGEAKAAKSVALLPKELQRELDEKIGRFLSDIKGFSPRILGNGLMRNRLQKVLGRAAAGATGKIDLEQRLNQGLSSVPEVRFDKEEKPKEEPKELPDLRKKLADTLFNEIDSSVKGFFSSFWSSFQRGLDLVIKTLFGSYGKAVKEFLDGFFGYFVFDCMGEAVGRYYKKSVRALVDEKTEMILEAVERPENDKFVYSLLSSLLKNL